MITTIVFLVIALGISLYFNTKFSKKFNEQRIIGDELGFKVIELENELNISKGKAVNFESRLKEATKVISKLTEKLKEKEVDPTPVGIEPVITKEVKSRRKPNKKG